jgi:hypothetical protein
MWFTCGDLCRSRACWAQWRRCRVLHDGLHASQRLDNARSQDGRFDPRQCLAGSLWVRCLPSGIRGCPHLSGSLADIGCGSRLSLSSFDLIQVIGAQWAQCYPISLNFLCHSVARAHECSRLRPLVCFDWAERCRREARTLHCVSFTSACPRGVRVRGTPRRLTINLGLGAYRWIGRVCRLRTLRRDAA